MTPTKIELLTLGNELLIGLRSNRHLTYLGEQLSRHGIEIRRNVVIHDDAVSIGREFLDCWSRADVVITTGGLGATRDDLTRDCVAKALGLEMVHDPEIEKSVEAYFERLGKTMPAINRRIADRPKGAEVLPNPVGTAPGLWIEQDGKIAILLPGPAAELQEVFSEEVLPRLRKKGLLGEEEEYVQIRTAGVGETSLAEKVEPLLELVPEVDVAYCAHEGMVDLRLRPTNGSLDRTKLQGLALQCARRMGSDFICIGHQSLQEVVFDAMRQKELTLAVAESCTGGLLASSFTDIPGSSKVFLGGSVCYSNDAKVQMLDIPESLIRQHGAVSAETAVAMAAGVAERLGAHYALSITGFAGPGGGSDRHPVGTIFIGLHTPDGAWSRKEHFSGGRDTVRKKAVACALDWLRRVLAEQHTPASADQPAAG